jgi:hypothetical protein
LAAGPSTDGQVLRVVHGGPYRGRTVDEKVADPIGRLVAYHAHRADRDRITHASSLLLELWASLRRILLFMRIKARLVSWRMVEYKC